jgi:hypothetical protein
MKWIQSFFSPDLSILKLEKSCSIRFRMKNEKRLRKMLMKLKWTLAILHADLFRHLNFNYF